MMIAYSYITAIILIALGTYTLLAKENLIKKVIGLGIFTDGIHLLLISIGYRAEGIAPIIRDISFSQFGTMVDPLPQALVLTSIVIDFSVTALALVLIIQVHKKFKTTDARELRSLKE
ncbi:MAG: sodium:proton antiporter [archaeon]